MDSKIDRLDAIMATLESEGWKYIVEEFIDTKNKTTNDLLLLSNSPEKDIEYKHKIQYINDMINLEFYYKGQRDSEIDYLRREKEKNAKK